MQTVKMDDGAALREASTADLVRELLSHGREVVGGEARALKERLERELGHARGTVKDEGQTLVSEAKQRLDHNLEAVKNDLREQALRATSAARPLAAGGVLAHAAFYVLLASLVLGLATFMPAWVAALIVGLATGIVAAVLLARGAHAAKQVGKNPLTRTNQQLTENKRWMRSTKEAVASTVRELKSSLSAVEWPRLRASSSDGPSRTI